MIQVEALRGFHLFTTHTKDNTMKMIYRKTDGKNVNPALTCKVGGVLLEHKTIEDEDEVSKGFYSSAAEAVGKVADKKAEEPKKPKAKRAHKKDGKFKPDDKSTPEVNEAYEN